LGNDQNVELRATIAKINYVERHALTFDESASPEKLAIRKSWLSAGE